MNDDSMIKIMQSLGLDYSPAIASTLKFEKVVTDLNKELSIMKDNALKSVKDINNTFSSQLGSMGNKQILDQWGKPFKTIRDEAKASATTVRDMAKSIKESSLAQMQAQAASIQQRASAKGLSDEYSKQAGTIREQLALVQARLQSEGKLSAEEVKQTQQLKEQLDILRAQTNTATHDKNTKNPSPPDEDFQNRASWFSDAAKFYAVKKAAQETTSTIKDVEMGMVEISRVMSDSSFLFDEYRDNLFKLGIDYGQTFDTVQNIALRWAQSGYNVADSLKLAETSLLALNAGELDAKYATEAMIGIMAQWQLQAEDLSLVMDKINKTADSYSTTAQDLVDGLLRSSGAAKTMNMSIEETLALLTLMRESSGRTGKEVGNALNSIISYLQRPKSIEVMEDMGIEVFADKAKTQFRNVLEIFQDIAANWDKTSKEIQNGFVAAADDAGLFNEELATVLGMQEKWNDLQKRDMSQAAAGVHRRNFFIGMIERMADVQGVLNNMMDAEGYLIEKNAQAMDTLEKKQQSLEASMEALAVAMGDAGLGNSLKAIADGGTNAINTINNMNKETRDFILGATNMFLAVKTLQIGMDKFGLQIPGISQMIGSLTSGTWSLTAALKAGGAGIADFAKANAPLLALSASVGVIVAITNHIKKQREEMEKSIEVFRQQREVSNSIDSLIPVYEELASKSNLTTDEQQKLLDVKRQITDLLPNTKQALDNENLSLSAQLEIIKELNKEELERAKNVARKNIANYEGQYENAKRDMELHDKYLKEYTARYDELYKRRNSLSGAEKRELKSLPHSIEQRTKLLERDKTIVDAVEESNRFLNEVLEIQNSILDENSDKTSKSTKSNENYKQSLKDLTEHFDKTTSKLQTYYSILNELNSKKGLSGKTLQDIITKHQELLPYLNDEAELRKQLIEIISKEEKTQLDAYKNMLIYNEEFFKSKVKGNSELVNKLKEYYGIDLENAKNLADAKEKLETNLIRNLSEKWGKYYKAVGNTITVTPEYESLARAARMGNKDAQKLFSEMHAERMKIVESSKHFDNLLNDTVFKGINSNLKTINMSNIKEKKDKQEQLAKDIEYNINLLRQEERALEVVRKQLTANKREQDIASDGARIKLKEKEIALIKEEQKALHNLANAARQVLQGKGVQIASDGRVIKEGINGLKQQLESTKLGFKFDASNFEIVNYDAIVKNLQDKVNSAKTKKEQDKIKEEADSVIKLADTYNNYLKVIQDASGQWLDKTVDIYKNTKEIEDAIKSLENDLVSIKDRITELNEQRAFEEFQNDIKKSILYLEPFANELDLLKTKFDLLSDTDYEGKIDVVADQFKASQRYGRRLRGEFEELADTTTRNSKETDELISTLTNLQQKIKQNTLNTIEYQKALDNLRIDQIVSKFSGVNKELEKELNLVNYNLKMLEGGLLAGTDIVFGVDFALPAIPEDLIEKKRKENEKLYREQQRYEEEIQELKELSLEQQRREQQEHYDKSMSELIKHYNDVLSKIKDYHGIEVSSQSNHQYNVNDIIANGLATTADNYNNTWAGIVSNLRGHLAEIESMINQANSGINNVTAKAKTVSSGSSNRDRDRGSYDKQVDRMQENDKYDRENSREIERISREHRVDTSTAREMDKANKRAGTKLYAQGTDYHDGGLAITGEIGEELAVLPNGKMVMLGTQGAELVDLPIGSQVIPHDETRKILSYTGNIDGEYIKQYKNGTKKYPSADELIRELKTNDNFLFHYSGYDGSPVVAMNGDVYIEQRDGSYSYSREVWNDTRRDEKLRLLYGDMLKQKYPDSSYLKEYEMIENFINSRNQGYGGSGSSDMSSTVRNQALGNYYMGGSRDKDLPSDFKSYRKERSVNMEQIQSDQQKIIDNIAKGLNVSQLREDLLKRIDEQLQEDVRMQFRIQDDLLKQQQTNSKKFMDELEREYLDAIDDGNVDKASKLAEQYNEASNVYLQTSEKIKDSIKDRYDYEFSLMDKRLDKHKRYMDELEYELSLKQIINDDDMRGANAIQDKMVQSTNEQVTLLYEVLNQLKEQQSLIEAGSYEWNIINGQIDATIDKIRRVNLEMARMAKSSFTNFSGGFKSSVSEYNKPSSGGGNTKDDSDKWLEGLEKELEVKKLMKFVNEHNLTLDEKQLEVVNSQGKIRKKELDIVRKQVELQQLQLKLENLKNQKTIQQYVQKEDGTWDFDRVEDIDAINKLEDDILDKRLDVIHAEKALRKELQSEADEAASVAASAAMDEFNKQMDEFEKIIKNAENRIYKSAQDFQQALLGTGLNFAEGELEEAVNNYWKYFIQTAEIFMKEALDRTNQFLNQQSKTFESVGNEHGVSYIEGLSDSIDKIMQGEGDVIEKQKAILDLFAGEYAEFAIAGNENGMAFVNGLIDSMATVDYELEFNDIALKIRTSLNSKSNELRQTGDSMGSSFMDSLIGAIDEVLEDNTIEYKTQTILQLLDKTNEYGTLGESLGKEFMQSLVDTITNVTDEVIGDGEGILSESINTMINMLDEQIANFAEKGDLQGVAYANALKVKLEEAMIDAEITQEDIINILEQTQDFDLAGLLSGDAYGSSLSSEMWGTKDNVDESSSEIVKGLSEEIARFGDIGREQGESYGDALTSAFMNTSSNIKSIVDDLASYVNSKEMTVNVTASIPDGMSLNGIQQFDTGGYTGDFQGGKLGILHEKERILSAQQTKSFDKFVAYVPDLLKNMQTTQNLTANINVPSLNKISANQSTFVQNQSNTPPAQIIHNHIDKLVFPDLHDAKEIEKAILDLPRMIIQNG